MVLFILKDGCGFKLYRKQTQNIVMKKLNNVLEKIANENN